MLGESLENYLEAIVLLEKNKEVRSIDLAHYMNVSRPSVNKAVNNLKAKGFITQQAYGTISLTEEGRQLANQILEKHQSITRFLTEALQLPLTIAEEDACRIEHVISNETYEAILQYLHQR